MSQSVAEQMKESNLFLSDVLVNYKTAQSFGHDNMLVKKYREMVDPISQGNVT